MGLFETAVDLDASVGSLLEQLTAEENRLWSRAAEEWLEFREKLADPNRRDKSLWVYGKYVVSRFSELAFYVIRTRKPPARIKNLSKVVTPFTSLKNRPRDVRKWVEKNRENMKILLQAKDWELRDEGVDVHGFSVSDVSGKGGMDQIIKLVGSAAAKIKQSRIPKARSVIYGDILVTNSLLGGKELAWYRTKEDTIWIRPKTKWGPASEQAFIHELGHRYLDKFASGSIKKNWIRHDSRLRTRLKYAGDNVRLKTGDKLPFTLSGDSEPATITDVKYNSRSGNLQYYIGKTEYVTAGQVESYYKNLSAMDVFPTEYAYRSGNWEETFCESFAMYILGTLPDDQMNNFRELTL